LKYLEGRFQGKGGLTLFRQQWLPDGDAQAVILIVHGYGEHSGRYANVVDAFVPRDYAIYALDHRGHGKSEGERVHVDSFDDYVEDLRTFYEYVRSETGELPIYMLGHSMGSFIAISYAAKYQDELQALILSGGGMGRKRSNASASSKMMSDLAATVSKDPDVVQAYRDDPLVFHGSPPESRRAAMASLREEMPAMVRAITLPVLIIAGGASPLGDGEGSKELFETVSSEDKTLHVYDGLMHEIFNEPERDEVFADMATWLEAH
jgi:alpha-beta hydrolase superfamily lysophospholipase